MPRYPRAVLGASIFPRHEILEKLGEGAMGVVYKARDTRLDRVVALKLLPPRAADCAEAQGRSVDEARAIAALNHPNIATIYEIGEDGGAPALVLEYLPGGTLRARIEARALSVHEIVDWMVQAAQGLAHAHRHGVIHRDVKPENLMFTEDGRVKITDFGVARFHDQRTRMVEQDVAGTLRYLAPECLQGLPADERVDVFSLGVVVEEMAAAADLSAVFAAVVAGATARSRADRFQTMDDFAAALRRIDSTPAPARETPTILVVEDDSTLRDVLEMGLSSEGYRVVMAGSGPEAIRRAAEEAPHLVLLDVTLPGLNGFDVCRELRRSGFNAPIMMVTGRTDEVDRVVGLEIGADDYLTKPFGRRELVTRVRAHLRRAYDMDTSRHFVRPGPHPRVSTQS